MRESKDEHIKAVLVGLEGALCPSSFLKEVLTPYLREKIPEFIRERRSDPLVRRILEEVRALGGSDLDLEGVINTLIRWAEESRKIPALRNLQEMIWEEGCRRGEIEVPVYEDAYEKLREWHSRGYPLYLYSSVPLGLQRTLLSCTAFGDITSLFSGYFDTRVGSKKRESSYRKIAKRIGLEPYRILFLSERPEELEAARGAGLKVVRLVREETDLPESYPYPQVRSFYEVPDPGEGF
jgi:enolase-phosphatase E1